MRGWGKKSKKEKTETFSALLFARGQNWKSLRQKVAGRERGEESGRGENSCIFLPLFAILIYCKHSIRLARINERQFRGPFYLWIDASFYSRRLLTLKWIEFGGGCQCQNEGEGFIADFARYRIGILGFASLFRGTTLQHNRWRLCGRSSCTGTCTVLYVRTLCDAVFSTVKPSGLALFARGKLSPILFLAYAYYEIPYYG